MWDVCHVEQNIVCVSPIDIEMASYRQHCTQFLQNAEMNECRVGQLTCFMIKKKLLYAFDAIVVTEG